MLKSETEEKLANQSGVTLLELLVVLVILAGVTAAIAVPMARRGPSEADRVAALSKVLSEAQWQARQSQNSVSIAFVSPQASEADYILPDSVTAGRPETATSAIVLFGDGSVRAPTLRLGERTITVDVLTGTIDVP